MTKNAVALSLLINPWANQGPEQKDVVRTRHSNPVVQQRFFWAPLGLLHTHARTNTSAKLSEAGSDAAAAQVPEGSADGQSILQRTSNARFPPRISRSGRTNPPGLEHGLSRNFTLSLSLSLTHSPRGWNLLFFARKACYDDSGILLLHRGRTNEKTIHGFPARPHAN